MNSPQPNPDTEALLQGYLEGTLTTEESTRLLTALNSQPQLIGVLLDGLRMDALIRQAVSQTGATSRAAATTFLPETASRLSSGRREEADQIPFSRLQSASLPQRRRPLWNHPAVLALAASVLLFVGLPAWYFGPTVGLPEVAEVRGDGASVERDGKILAAMKGSLLQPGDVLKTEPTSEIILAYGKENTRITNAGGSELKLLVWQGGKRFMLTLGKLEASVARQRPFQPMIITTPQAEARVLGTKFTLTATTNATRLEVTEGKVKLTRKSDDAAVKVSAGHCAVVAPRYELAALPITGRVLREVWHHVQGNQVHELTLHPGFPNRPDERDFPATFETPKETTGAFGVRLRGYLIPDEGDSYAFILSASGTAALWLSEDESPENRIKIAQTSAKPLPGAPKYRASGATQNRSAPVRLEAGRCYYIELIHVHGAERGEPALRVAWTRGGREAEEISSACLAPFESHRGGSR